MASNSFLYSIIFLQSLIEAIVLLFLLFHPPNYGTHTSQPALTESHGLNWDQLYSNFKPRPDSPKVVIQVDNITKALSATGFKLMALILDRNLPSLVPYANSDFGAIEDGTYKKNNTITLYNGSKITIFVPPDKAISFKRQSRTYYKYLIATTKFDIGDFSDGLRLPFIDSHWGTFNVKYVNYVPAINDARITHWNIYNDGHVIVHGVENSLRPYEDIIMDSVLQVY